MIIFGLFWRFMPQNIFNNDEDGSESVRVSGE